MLSKWQAAQLIRGLKKNLYVSNNSFQKIITDVNLQVTSNTTNTDNDVISYAQYIWNVKAPKVFKICKQSVSTYRLAVRPPLHRSSSEDIRPYKTRRALIGSRFYIDNVHKWTNILHSFIAVTNSLYEYSMGALLAIYRL